jgi:SAM-dependent methyltransferase
MDKTITNYAQEYDRMLNKGIKLSGEEKRYFILGRLQDLICNLPTNFVPNKILDYGCGIGDTTNILSEIYPDSQVDGFDPDSKAIACAKNNYSSPKLLFSDNYKLLMGNKYDLCYSNGVFHHILPRNRLWVIKRIRHTLNPGGFFALFENNPWNLATRFIMARIPFDRDAHLLCAPQAYQLLHQGGFVIQNLCRYLFYFPHRLSFLRNLEHYLSRFPFGAQYYILATKQK